MISFFCLSGVLKIQKLKLQQNNSFRSFSNQICTAQKNKKIKEKSNKNQQKKDNNYAHTS